MSNRFLPGLDSAALRKLGIALLVLSLVAGAGCASLDGNGGSSDASLVEYVPQDQTVVMEFDMAIAQDDTTQQLLAAGEEEDPESEAELQSSIAEFEAETGLDPGGFQSAMIYGQTDEATTSVDEASSEDDAGVVVDTTWDTEEVLSALRSNESTSLTEVEYTESETFYRIESETSTDDSETYLGVHGDGIFVIGTENPVRNSLDVTYDGANELDGALRQAYDDTRDGYVSFAMTVPETDDAGIGASIVESLDAVTGVYYTDGDEEVGVEGRIKTTSSDTAGLINATVQSQLRAVENDPEFAELVQNLEIDTDGSDLVVNYESDVQTLIEASESDD